MSSAELPSRAKPEALHSICRHLRGTGGIEKQDLYEELDIDRRQIRASVDFGAKLGFLNVEGEIINLDEFGIGLSFPESIDSDGVKTVFQDAVERYEPYREAFLWIAAQELVEDIKEEPCIPQSAFKMAVEKSVDQEVTRRELNLLIKTAQAAGLGEFITGRKGLETRLRLSAEYERFMQRLIEDFGLPEKETEEGTSTRPVEDIIDSAEESKEIPQHVKTFLKVDSEGMRLTAEYPLTGKSEKDIIELIEKVRAAG